jgi:hypothetical protein
MKIRATTTHPATAFFTMAATPPTSRRPCGRHPSSSERDGPHMLQRHHPSGAALDVSLGLLVRCLFGAHSFFLLLFLSLGRGPSVVLVIGGLPRQLRLGLRLRFGHRSILLVGIRNHRTNGREARGPSWRSWSCPRDRGRRPKGPLPRLVGMVPFPSKDFWGECKR